MRQMHRNLPLLCPLTKLRPSSAFSAALQYADRERGADQPNTSRAQLTTYPVNLQAKEEVACVGLNRNREESLQHVDSIILLKDSSRDPFKEGDDFRL
ncbi:hypothetical protein TNCV_4901271 [Trichonephila clavipes]|nr:hypothetical protein TNCV_4901271 [Trichonephila clavipes]